MTTLSVGVPTLFLALWAQPGPLPKGSIPRRVTRFVLTPVVITSGIALLLFYGMLLLNLVPFGAVQVRLFAVELAPRYAVELAVARTGLATFLVLTGLLLLVFAAPPSPWWVGAEPLSADRRPALLAGRWVARFLGLDCGCTW